jgi:hypothetical protein
LEEEKSKPEEIMNTWTFVIVWVCGWAILGGLIIVVIDALVVRRKQRRLITAGLYPKPATETDEDVQRLLQAGYPDMAIRCYQAVHRVSYSQAKDRLIGVKPGEYGFVPIGLVFGLSLGLFLKNTALGAALGLLLGLSFAFLMRKKPPRDKGSR